jgi:hypothetical protein
MALASAIHDISADRDLESLYHADGAEPDALLDDAHRVPGYARAGRRHDEGLIRR